MECMVTRLLVPRELLWGYRTTRWMDQNIATEDSLSPIGSFRVSLEISFEQAKSIFLTHF